MEKIYLDNSATTPLDEEVLKYMNDVSQDFFGNPSSIHNFGKDSRNLLEEAREKIAQIFNVNSDEIFFTSGGTESDNWALKGVSFASKKNHIITSSIEHPAILNSCKKLEKFGVNVTYVPVNSKGLVDVKNIENSINDNTVLVSVMMANNEIGTLEPIEEIGEFLKGKNIYFHTDAVQAVGNIPIDISKMNIDLLSLSSHKFYGPKGVGCLYVKNGTNIDNIINGGSQERGKRAGTENVIGVLGMAKALELANNNMAERSKNVKELRDSLYAGILKEISGVRLNGGLEKRLANNLNLTFDGVNSQTLLIMLNMRGIAVSAGSACSANSTNPSHVLKAIGLTDDEANNSIRFSIGYKNTKEEINYVIRNLKDIVERVRK